MAGIKTWTNDEMAIIKKNAHIMTDLEIFALLSNINSDKTLMALIKKRQRMKLTKEMGRPRKKTTKNEENRPDLS